MTKVKLGECCPVMGMVLTRDTHGKSKPQGFTIGEMFSLSNGEPTRQRLIYEFTKAKKTDVSEFGAKSEYANSTYAPVNYCPFCGEAIKP